jgi:hypothetical protein
MVLLAVELHLPPGGSEGCVLLCTLHETVVAAGTLWTAAHCNVAHRIVRSLCRGGGGRLGAVNPDPLARLSAWHMVLHIVLLCSAYFQ